MPLHKIPRTRSRHASIVSLLLLASTTLQAATLARPPSWGTDTPDPPGPRDTDFDSDQITLGSETLYLGVSKLSEARGRFGIGRIRDIPGSGEHAVGDRWLCYTLIDGGEKQRLWLGGSSASFNGPDMLGDYVVESLPASAAPTSQCPRLPARFGPLSLDHGVQLGMPIDDLAAELPGLRRHGDVWVMAAYYVSKHWGVERLWAIRVVDGRIVGARVHTLVTT